MTILLSVQTAAWLASGASTADTLVSLVMDPMVWPASLVTVQLPLAGGQSAELPLISYTPWSDAIQ
jgi:hypothetical protein